MSVDPRFTFARSHLSSRREELDSLAGELEILERREREISAVRQRLHKRLDSFPNVVTQRHERTASDERRALHREIDERRAHARSLALQIGPEAA
jgi:predicted transcriptional regulator